MSRILRLALLAPSIVEEILDGRADHELMLEQLERPLPASWEEQREALRAGAARASVNHGTFPRGRGQLSP